jgi:predicted porin
MSDTFKRAVLRVSTSACAKRSNTRGFVARKSMLGAAVLAGCAAIAASSSALAADDGSLTWNGITLYGVVDIGVAYESHGAPVSQSYGQGLLYIVSRASNKSITAVAPNGLSQSRLGLRGKEKLNETFDFVFNLEGGFNPQSGKLTDGPASLVHNNGVALANQTSGSDSSRAGQLFNGQAYAGFSSADYGTLTLGRHNSLLFDNCARFDPMNGSYAFSVLGYSGVTAGGGDTEDSRLDDSVKYVYKNDLFHAGGLYQFGKSGGSPGEAWQGNLGIDYHGFSVDGVYAHKKDAISASSLSAAQVLTLPRDSLSATISDNTSYTLDAIYATGPFKFNAGYEHIKFENPSLPVAAGFAGLGGYWISVTNNTGFPHPRVLEVSWVGLKYLITPNFDITGAWYHYDQNAYGAKSCSNTSATNCSGTENVYSVRLDYRLSKRLDVYAGVASSKVSGGLASGFLNTSNYDPMVGLRFQF